MSRDAERKAPTWGAISRERPLVILQTNPRFGDSEDGGVEGKDPLEEATRHGREAVRVWNETLPDAIRPYCQLQMEIRVRDHEARYDRFRKVLDELQAAGVPANIQFADPHDWYVFDPEYVEKLLAGYPCIESMTITEISYEHYRSFNVPRYAISPEARYAMDVIDLAAKYGKHLSISLQGLKWMHIAGDVLNEPLLRKVAANSEYIMAVNEHIGPQHLPRQTSVWGIWLAGFVGQWGVEPQSWWFENGRMIAPGVFGQYQASNTRVMPPALYRAMLLQGALLGATVYQFEPFWDLFDYDNSVCWREVICPTLLEIIEARLISTKAQCFEKAKVAYQYKTAQDISEFHENLRDVDWIHDEGLLARAAYGLWDKFMEHELIPNRDRYFFIPLLPPHTPRDVLDRFEHVVQPGACDSESGYEALLNRHYPGKDSGAAWVCSMNGHTYVMQTHENLYERQDYAVDLPKAVRGIAAAWTDEGLELQWPHDAGARLYRVGRGEAGTDIAAETADNHWIDAEAKKGEVRCYAVYARTDTKERVIGTVNYLDYLRFSESESRAVEFVEVDAGGVIAVRRIPEAEDDRPASQVVFPTFEGVDGAHRGIAEAIVERIEAFRAAYNGADWKRVHELYASDYRDNSGYGHEYAGRAWKWWFYRNNSFCFLRQIRWWDFGEYAETGRVRAKLFALCRALRWDDSPFGSGYDGTLRIPRTADEEVLFTWRQDTDGVWRILATDPALPNFQEMLWCSRGGEDQRAKLTPGIDGEPAYHGTASLRNTVPFEQDWLPKEEDAGPA